MTYILGINELYHDISVALVKDGELLGVIEEERLNRIKHTPGLCWGGRDPRLSLNWCLNYFGLSDRDIEVAAISYDMNPYLSIKTIVDAVICNWRRMTVKHIFSQRIGSGDPAAKVIQGNSVGYFYHRRKYLAELERRFKKVVHIKHHLCHAASTFRMSGFDQANILIIDGLGEDHSTSLFYGDGNTISKPFKNYSQYQSLGMLYKTITFMLGFGYFGDGRTMGLSAFGEFSKKYENILQIRDHDYFIKLEEIRKVGAYAREKNSKPLLKEHCDIATTIQKSLEKAALELAKFLYTLTGSKKLCLAGGVALNCCMNSILLNSGYIDEIFVQPGAMDMGTAIGAALQAYAEIGESSKTTLKHVFYGPEFSDQEIEETLKNKGFSYQYCPDIADECAKLLADHQVVSWFQGRMEFGPRALGARSILANPTRSENKDLVNKIKGREAWRPLAPSVLLEDMPEYFENPHPSPFMTLNFKFKKEAAEKVPAVVHVDGSARVQTVAEENNPLYYRLIKQFKEYTGIPMILNTSFNRRIEPIVCTPDDALETFAATDMKYLAIGSFLVSKNNS